MSEVNNMRTSIAKDKPSNRLVGAHMPTSGGIQNSLIKGREIGCDAVQIFTCSPRQWLHPPLKTTDVDKFKQAREDSGIDFVVAHDSYLINLAAPSEEVLQKSILAMQNELDRAETLGLKWLVTHMGAHLGEGEEAGLERLAASIKTLLEQTDAANMAVGIAMENTAGQGTTLGWKFEHIGYVMAMVGSHPRLGMCLDTCHTYASGYDITNRDGYNSTIVKLDELVGLDKLTLIHANDSMKELGSRVDRHDHIGEGKIGPHAFRWLMQDERLAHAPVIVETPEADTMHETNVRLLRQMMVNDTI